MIQIHAHYLPNHIIIVWYYNMAGYQKLYNSIATNAYCLYKSAFVNCPARAYLSYSQYLAFACFPKTSYSNVYEPEYTKNSVKYNLPIVLTMFGTTIWLINQKKNQARGQWFHKDD